MKRPACLVAGGIIALSTAATVTAQPAPPPPPAPYPPPTPALERPAASGAGDTHIYGIGQVQTIDCNGSTLLVNGSYNVVTATGNCFAVTMQGSGNTVVADTVLNDITVYGYDQTVLYKFGDPYVWDRGREFGMTNRIDRAPA
ncbi:DUF3060 domain-containing protein [Mycobacterium sp.]|jgi:hypothetical protein|uniref:DUF3060 domain-containing protein n=1 Tax=Mycobacterium sp. TaxID=1785 RepID=UPI002D4FAA03|nr:DUF3060 domain-containing protein [Mycobacterium sp.]HZA12701.1 DUF3060 domain-containing protein [Mycobacterium sp.]